MKYLVQGSLSETSESQNPTLWLATAVSRVIQRNYADSGVQCLPTGSIIFQLLNFNTVLNAEEPGLILEVRSLVTGQELSRPLSTV